MSTQKVERVVGTGIPLFLDDIDTDRIIPARYLRCVTFDGLGEHAFKDDRKQDPHHPFDDARFKGASILISGRNFGCGSSREHAPQALMRFGIQAIVAESFAEIFFGNCTSLGLPCVCAARGDLQKLTDVIAKNPKLEVSVDLQSMQVKAGDLTVPCTMLDTARTALITGQFDFLGQLLEGEPEIRAAAEKIPYLANFA